MATFTTALCILLRRRLPSNVPEPAQSSNGWLGAPTNDNDDDVKLDIDTGNADVATQEDNGDIDMGSIWVSRRHGGRRRQ
jgi:hypothetical protein